MRLATSYILLAETVTDDGTGQTIEGSHGLMVDDEYVPMDGICGTIARLLLDGAHADNADIIDHEWDAAALAESILGALDYVDDRGDELIAYAADLPRVDNDEPYVRAIAIRYNTFD